MIDLNKQIEGELIDGLLDGGDYAAALSTLARAFAGVNTGVVVLASAGEPAPLYHVLEPHQATLASYLPDIMDDPWVAAMQQRRGPIATTGSRMVRPSIYRKSRYYADFVRPAGHEHIAIVGHFAEATSISFTVYRTARATDFDDAELDRMAALLPGVARFYRLWSAEQHGRSTAMSGAIYAHCFEVDRHGLENVGKGVAEFLHQSRVLSLATGELQACGDAGKRLRRTKAQCLDGRLQEPCAMHLSEDVVAIVRPRLVLDAMSHRRWRAVVELVRAAPNPSAMERSASALDLTHAERLVAEALLRGETLRDVAERSGRSLHTVRNQLKSAMAKLGVKRQVDLARFFCGAG